MKSYCIHATVHGKVQGVFYRDSTRQKANALNITGWVKNNSDGTVSLIACGTENNIHALIDWLHEGPPTAKVTQVEWHEIASETHTAFQVIK